MNIKKRGTERQRIKAPALLADCPELAADVAELEKLLDLSEQADLAANRFDDEGLRRAQQADREAFDQAARVGRADPGRTEEARFLREQAQALGASRAAMEVAVKKRSELDQEIADRSHELLDEARLAVAELRERAARSTAKAEADIRAFDRAASLERILTASHEAGEIRGASSFALGIANPYSPPPTGAAEALASITRKLEHLGEREDPAQLRPKPTNPVKSKGMLSYE